MQKLVVTIIFVTIISNYEFCLIKQSKFEISKVYTIKWQRYTDAKFRVFGKDSISLSMWFPTFKVKPFRLRAKLRGLRYKSCALCKPVQCKTY